MVATKLGSIRWVCDRCFGRGLVGRWWWARRCPRCKGYTPSLSVEFVAAEHLQTFEMAKTSKEGTDAPTDA